MSRLEGGARIAAVALLSAGLVAGCTSSRGEGAPSFSTASASAGERSGAGSSSAASSAAANAPSSPATEVFRGDQSIKQELQQAQRGERIILVGPLIGSITRTPSLQGESYITTVLTQDSQGDDDVAAIATNGTCLFDALRDKGELGKPSFIPGRWKVDRRIDRLTADVTVPYALVTPKTAIHLESVTVSGNKVQC